MPSNSVTLVIPGARAFSINRATGRDARWKSSAYKDWATIFHQQIIQHDFYADLLLLAEDFLADDSQTIELDMHVQYPKEMYFNTKGTISSKTLDITNCEKLAVDILIGSIMGINDKHLVDLRSTKGPGLDYRVTFIIRLKGPQHVI